MANEKIKEFFCVVQLDDGDFCPCCSNGFLVDGVGGLHCKGCGYRPYAIGGDYVPIQENKHSRGVAY